MESKAEVKQQEIYEHNPELLDILLKDRTTEGNIRWATNDYEKYGLGYKFNDQIRASLITGTRADLVRPRVFKEAGTKLGRTKDMAEVFTPAWICNKQNNLVDNSWFNREDVFNVEIDKTWKATEAPVDFNGSGKTWQTYVKALRMEVACGEAPYLTSRYDAVSGTFIQPSQRIGMLDRKLRIVSENTADSSNWLHWGFKALKAIYGFEYQGDNILLARENLLASFAECYAIFSGKELTREQMRKAAEIVSWNIWQMDGLTYAIPGGEAEEDEKAEAQLGLALEFDDDPEEKKDKAEAKMPLAKIKNWEENLVINFKSLLKKDLT